MPNSQNKKRLEAKKKAQGFEGQLNDYQGTKHKQSHHKHSDANMVLKQDTYRLNKVIAASGLYSRRQADGLIESGKVQVNGVTIRELGYKITNPNQVSITVHGQKIRTQHRIRTIAFNKPTDVITTRSDEKDRKTIFSVLPEELHGLDPAGRLDRKTSGLLILTNDGDLLHELTHPRYHLPKVYRVHLNKHVDKPEALAEKLLNGIFFEEEQQLAVADEVFQLDFDEFGISIHTGMNRQVRRMFEACGYDVTSLKRIAIGPYIMQGLRPGEWKELRYNDVMMLKKALKKAGNAAPVKLDTQQAFALANEAKPAATSVTINSRPSIRESESESNNGSPRPNQWKTGQGKTANRKPNASTGKPNANPLSQAAPPSASSSTRKPTVEETVKRLKETMPAQFNSMADLEAWLSH